MRDDQPQRPTDVDGAAWEAYRQALGMPWRTEPEIDTDRQPTSPGAGCRAVTANIEQDSYPVVVSSARLSRGREAYPR